MPDKLADYVLKMDSALRERKRFVAYNRDIHHAHAVVCLAFRYAQEKVLLLSHRLDPELYASQWFLQEAEDFLKRSGSLQILAETDLDERHPLIALADRFPDSVQIVRIPAKLQEQYRYNYMVVDDIGYRFERDRAEPRAVVAFHDENDGAEMIESLKRNFGLLSELVSESGQT